MPRTRSCGSSSVQRAARPTPGDDGAQRLARDHGIGRIERRGVTHLEAVSRAKPDLGERECLGLRGVHDGWQRSLQCGRQRARAHEQGRKACGPTRRDRLRSHRRARDARDRSRRAAARSRRAGSIRAARPESGSASLQRVVVRGGVELERPVQRVVGDDRQESPSPARRTARAPERARARRGARGSSADRAADRRTTDGSSGSAHACARRERRGRPVSTPASRCSESDMREYAGAES